MTKITFRFLVIAILLLIAGMMGSKMYMDGIDLEEEKRKAIRNIEFKGFKVSRKLDNQILMGTVANNGDRTIDHLTVRVSLLGERYPIKNLRCLIINNGKDGAIEQLMPYKEKWVAYELNFPLDKWNGELETTVTKIRLHELSFLERIFPGLRRN